jgi:hypothetical protein
MIDDANREARRILRRNPSLLAMELLWRWSFGLGLLALLFYAYAQLRPAIFLTEADAEAFHTQDPFALASAISDLTTPLLPLVFKLCAQLFALAAVLWAVISACGRGIITRVLVARLSVEHGIAPAADAPRWLSHVALHAARVLMLLILVMGYLGGLFLASLVGPAQQSPVLTILILCATFAASLALWSYVNRVLALAPVFVALDGALPLDATVSAIRFFGRNPGRLRSVLRGNNALRAAVVLAITVVGAATVALPAPSWTISALLLLETLLYFVLADFLHLARLAAQVAVVVHERVLTAPLAASAEQSGTTPL